MPAKIRNDFLIFQTQRESLLDSGLGDVYPISLYDWQNKFLRSPPQI